ncbi:hypothetical protein AB0F77_25970 [Streptomyces sp. NPDC026672]|uniref:hypothetical protein n=1 Tax=unclassified Streptomyces TaxID=2593676 RepID=UPI0033EA6E83
MEPPQLPEFIDRYTHILTMAWSSRRFSQRLLTAPHSVLSEHGLGVAPDATVEIVQATDDEYDLTAQFDIWRKGFRTGHFVLRLHARPRSEWTELSVAELGDLAGGVNALRHQAG